MKSSPTIFLDTMIFRYAASIKLVQSAKSKSATMRSPGGISETIRLLVYANDITEPNLDLNINEERRAIRKIADLARDGNAQLCYSHEVNLELLFQPEVDLARGRMFGVACSIVHSPLLRKRPEEFDESDMSRYPFRFWDSGQSGGALDILSEVANEFFRLPVGCFISRCHFRSLILGLRAAQKISLSAAKIMAPYL